MQTHEAAVEQEARDFVSQEYSAARTTNQPLPTISQDQVWNRVMLQSSRQHLPDSKREAIWETAMDAAEEQINIEMALEQ